MSEDARNLQFTPEQKYLKDLLDKFNADPDCPELDDTVKLIMQQVTSVQQEVSKLNKDLEKLNEEVKERQERANVLVQQIISKQGESQGYINTLLKLRK